MNLTEAMHGAAALMGAGPKAALVTLEPCPGGQRVAGGVTIAVPNVPPTPHAVRDFFLASAVRPMLGPDPKVATVVYFTVAGDDVALGTATEPIPPEPEAAGGNADAR